MLSTWYSAKKVSEKNMDVSSVWKITHASVLQPQLHDMGFLLSPVNLWNSSEQAPCTGVKNGTIEN